MSVLIREHAALQFSTLDKTPYMIYSSGTMQLNLEPDATYLGRDGYLPHDDFGG